VTRQAETFHGKLGKVNMPGLQKYLLLFGLLYGIGLSIFGFLAAGFGHGTFVLLGLASSVFARNL